MNLPLFKRPDGRTPEAIFDQRVTDLAIGVRQVSVDGVEVHRTTRGDVVLPQMSQGSGGGSISLKPYRLWDVQDDYLICLAPPANPPSGLGSMRFIGEVVDDQFDADHKTILINPDSIPPIKYTPSKSDVIWQADKREWEIFNGTAWVQFGVKWVDVTAATPKTYVAKEYLHRTSLVSMVYFDTAHGFSYIDGPTEAWSVGTSGRFNKIRHDYDGSTTESQRLVPPWTEGEPIFAIQCNGTGVVRPVLNSDGSPKIVDGNPVKTGVNLHIFGRSCQWGQRAD